MSNISFEFANPLFLLVLVAAVPLALIPYFRLKKAKRRNRNRITSLILHLVIVLLCTLVLSGFTIKMENSLQKKETFIIVDVSKSVEEQADDIDDYVASILADVDGSNKIGIVTFSSGATVASPLSNRTGDALSALKRARKQGADKAENNATDINEALIFTAKQFSNKQDAKIIIITDGIDTENSLIIESNDVQEDRYIYTNNESVLQTVRAIAAQGISVDTVYFKPHKYGDDMQIESVVFDKGVSATDVLSIDVTVRSHGAGRATLTLYDRYESGQFVKKDEKSIDVTPGEWTFPFENFKFGQSGLHTIKVELTDYAKDELEENNVYYSYVNITDGRTILIIDGDGTQANAGMKSLVEGLGYNARVYSPNSPELPQTVAALSGYDEVILMNVNAATLPVGYDRVLETYVKAGGGLFTTGGSQTYFYGNMGSDTYFSSFLPVNVTNLENSSSNAIMFVIDASGSMYYDFNKGGSSDSDCFYDENSAGFQNTAMNYIKVGLRDATLNIFSKNDYIGIMHFGKDSYKMDLPLTTASSRGAIYNAINGITTIKGTNWSTPLTAAAEQLRSTSLNVDTKQIIFITDGSPAELSSAEKNTDFAALTRNFEENWGITTSVIAVNGCNSIDANLMNNITTAVDKSGSKRFYNCTTPAAFTKAISDECKAASTDPMNASGPYDITITKEASKEGAVFKDILEKGGTMPQVQQYNGFKVKDGVDAFLTADNKETGTSDAIYARWGYGNGKVGSFASDLSAWASTYYKDDTAKEFLENVIRSLLPSTQMNPVAVKYERKNFTTDVYIFGDIDVAAGEIAYIYQIVDPDGIVLDWDNTDGLIEAFTPTGDNECMKTIDTGKQGVYKIWVVRERADGTWIDNPKNGEGFYYYFTCSYSQEYNTFFGDDAAQQEFLENVAAVGNGHVLFLSDSGLNHKYNYETVVKDPKMIFAIIAAVLFILDIVARKFNFKWPHEWFRKKEAET